MSATRLLAAASAAIGLALAAAPALAAPPPGCGLDRIVELPVTMAGMRPIVPAQINGHDAYFLADSGAFYSLITPGTAAQFGLPLSMSNIRLRGIGGDAATSIAEVKTFTLSGVPIPRVLFIVGGSETGNAGLLGQNVLGVADVEYDLAGGAIRLMKPHGCGEHAALAYWAVGKPYSVMDISEPNPANPHTIGTVYVNGAKLKAIFDTGAATSVLTLNAAAKAGIKPGGPGVEEAGFSRGLGRHLVKTWIAPFASFKIGDEEVRNTRLRIGEIGVDADMLIGADFFLSHRVYVSNSQHKLYFTYNGGAVFNLKAGALTQEGEDEPPKASPLRDENRAEPTDADGYSRRGAAFTSRRDYDHAIADLTRAVELAPTEARYLYERGMAHLANKQADLALADFDAALKLKPDDVQTLMIRAEVRLAARQPLRSRADLDAAAAAAPKEDDIRLRIANLYQGLDVPDQALAQFDLWIAAHPADSHRPQALSGRCRARALLGTDLDKALIDCNTAIGMGPKTPPMLVNRGLVHLRRNELDKAVTDFDAALALDSQDAWALFGRGVARAKQGKAADGAADEAAAIALEPRLGIRMQRHGIGP